MDEGQQRMGMLPWKIKAVSQISRSREESAVRVRTRTPARSKVEARLRQRRIGARKANGTTAAAEK